MSNRISIEELKKLITYEPDTGNLYWIPRGVEYFKNEQYCKIWNSRQANQIIKCVDKSGYIKTSILGRQYKGHQIAWAIAKGEWPDMCVDHINGIKTDNRICNLRLATKEENMWNSKPQKNNKLGIKGISIDKKSGKYKVSISSHNKKTHIGYFECIELAKLAYSEFADKIHGNFVYKEIV
jgi:hypothetical protein